MNVNFEKLEGNLAKITIEVDAVDFSKALTKAYNKIKGQITIPGFRKGKAPQSVVERTYGVEVLYEDAANFAMNDSYPAAAKETGLEIVSQPEITVEQIEKGKSFIYAATVAVKPQVKLGDYKGLEYKAYSVDVTDEDIEKELKSAQEKNSRKVNVEDRPAKNGDKVNINFDGYVDGKQFEGGKADNYDLVLGSHSFIDNFEDQIEGHVIGDEFDVNVTFPDKYSSKELENKPATFKVKLNKIEETILPELNDEFASDVSEFETLEEYKADIAENIKKRKTNDAETNAKDELLQKASDNAEMILPDAMVNEQARALTQQMAMNMQQYGISFEQYLQMIGQTQEQFVASQRPHAVKTIKGRLTLEAIAEAENLLATDEDVEEQLKEMSEAYKMDIEKIRSAISADELDDLKHDIAANKAAKFLLDNGIAVEESKETSEDAEKTAE